MRLYRGNEEVERLLEASPSSLSEAEIEHKSGFKEGDGFLSIIKALANDYKQLTYLQSASNTKYLRFKVVSCTE